MARTLGALFSEAALAPVAEAGRYLATRNVDAGLAVLTRERLIEAVRRGVELVARAAGVKPLDVFGRLPMAELEALVEQLEANQSLATKARRSLTGAAAQQAGADAVPVAGRDVADPGVWLRHLATSKEAVRDGELATALGELAYDVDSWQQALGRCRAQLDAAQDLTRRYRRRRLLRIAAWGLIPLLVIATAAGFTYRHLARSRIDAILSQGGCAAEQVGKLDLMLASDAQVAALERERKACQERREKERREAEARKKAEAERREQERRRQERLARCEALRKRFEAGELDETDDTLAGKHAELFRRLAKGTIRPDDVEAQLDELPCKGTPAAQAIGAAFATLVADEAPTWLGTRTPSKSVQQLLIDHRSAIAAESLKHMGGHIDQAAGHAVMSGQKKDIERFAELCTLKKALALKLFGNCVAVLALAKDK